jgi:hypothetical protein
MNQISLNPSVITRLLGIVALLLILASILGQISKFLFGHGSLYGLVLLFHLDAEQNIPTYFSMLLMLLTALLLLLIAILNKNHRMPHVSKWVILSCWFQFMAFDEAFQVHERLILPIRKLLGNINLGIFHFAWTIPAIILVIFLGLFFRQFLFYLSATVRFRFLISAALYIGGALGVELIGGGYAKSYGTENWIYSMITTVEESLEIAGLIFFIWTLLKYCGSNYKKVQLRFEA